MGNQCARAAVDMHTPIGDLKLQETPVFVHLYDLGTTCAGQALNTILRPLGTPALHCGVEIFDSEWSYCFLTKDGRAYEGSGIFTSTPRECEGHHYKQSLALGTVALTRDLFRAIIKELEMEWLAIDYDIFSHNCCHFSNELCTRLGAGELPEWIMRLSHVGHALSDREFRSAEALCCDRPITDQADHESGGGTLCCCSASGAHEIHNVGGAHRWQREDPWKDDVVPSSRLPKAACLNGTVEERSWNEFDGYDAWPGSGVNGYASPREIRRMRSISRTSAGGNSRFRDPRSSAISPISMPLSRGGARLDPKIQTSRGLKRFDDDDSFQV